RIQGRVWEGEPGASLLVTIVIPAAAVSGSPGGIQSFPLKVGLAVRSGLESLAAPHLHQDLFLLKWPNDIMGYTSGRGKQNYTKICGILCEAISGWLLAGIGINLRYGAFPQGLAGKASCLEEVFASAGLPGTGTETADFETGTLARSIAGLLEGELTNAGWKKDYEGKMWEKGKLASFTEGHPGHGLVLQGIIEGIDDEGKLVLRHQDGSCGAYLSGEISFALANPA
ncbi:MAG: hypothetical protein LLF89_04530, partial [Spirochaetaceae bacterium]|nr:hypothetical protein [Spirochaetaceae bacterium]